MINNSFQPELLAAAQVDYQVKVQSVGNFPSELLSVLMTEAFPLSPSPTPSSVEGIKVFTYHQRYLCFCWFFFTGRTDELGRETNSSRVLIFPLEVWQGVIPTLADVKEWLKHHDIENMSSSQFFEKVKSLENSTLSPEKLKKAETTIWFPHLLAQFLQQRQVILLGSTPAEVLPWLEILWFYTPSFLRLQIDWCSYTWSLRCPHEQVIITTGQVEQPKSPSFWESLFKLAKSSSEDTPLRFDTVQGISNYSVRDLKFKSLEWLCWEWINPQPWANWQNKQKRQFLLEAFKDLSQNPRPKLTKIISRYPQSSKLEELTNLIRGS
ncbi:hypothetical protein A5482_015720 (plasmid) [Cyanobacterium sp. IPPAS B-1200]|uniref:hypothetical protein n=1 Tax=Cyanobacterium sp. IPPAS B-1200 TaxID=1562720 RepID=UPI0008526C5D|nr:hypothetical protein [Cyanobacterium sp. IPPAS B-1200]OEJ78535.1 hypothetical protein A5482_12540 [Cyanobacterium sp. IPPAS B-1200]